MKTLLENSFVSYPLYYCHQIKYFSLKIQTVSGKVLKKHHYQHCSEVGDKQKGRGKETNKILGKNHSYSSVTNQVIY